MGVAKQKHLLSPQERRQRNRQEVIDAILAAARDIIRRDGVAALNLNEVARLVGMQPPSLYKYFPNKFAIYDILYRMSIRLFREQEAEVWKTTEPGWERIQAWFETRLVLVQEHPDLYHLAFDLSAIPGFVPSEEGKEEARKLRTAGIQALAEIIDVGVIAPPMPPDRAYDLLLAIRHGIIAEHLGKKSVFQVGEEDRFTSLIPEIFALLKVAWAPQSREPAELTISNQS